MAKQKFKMSIPTQSETRSENTNQPKETIPPETKGKDSNAANYLSSLSPKSPQRPIEMKFIPRSKITFSENNDYEQNDIEQLAESILMLGLIHPMEARYDIERDLYIIESGERRTRAIDLLLEKYLSSENIPSSELKYFQKNVKGFANGYPLTIKHPDTDENGELTELEEIESMLRLDEANLQVRDISAYNKAIYIKRKKELLQRRNNLLPQEQKVNVLNELSEQSHLSRRTVMKYVAVAEKLIPELQEEFDKNNISLNEGSKYAQLSEEEQRIILQLIQSGVKASKTEIERLKHSLDEQRKEKEDIVLKLDDLSKSKADAENRINELLTKKAEEQAKLEKHIRESISEEQDIKEAERAALTQSLKERENEISRLKKASHSDSEQIKELQKKISVLEKKPELSAAEKRLIQLNAKSETSLSTLQHTLNAVLENYKELSHLAPDKAAEYKESINSVISKYKIN